jgi:hypothetical protein
MPELQIKRKKQLFAPLNCCFHVYIDNERKTTLSNGEEDKLTIEEGNHTLQIRNNYFKTREVIFDIAKDDVKVIETSSMTVLTLLYFFAPVILLIFATLKFFHVLLPGYVSLLALFPLFLFIVLGFLAAVLKRGILLKGIQ